MRRCCIHRSRRRRTPRRIRSWARPTLAEYAGPWPVALACSLSITGMMLALIPIRRGERWAIWTSLATLMILLGTRMVSDPRCLVVLDPHQHGCHTFMIAVFLGVIGLLLARFSRRKPLTSER